MVQLKTQQKLFSKMGQPLFKAINDTDGTLVALQVSNGDITTETFNRIYDTAKKLLDSDSITMRKINPHYSIIEIKIEI